MIKKYMKIWHLQGLTTTQIPNPFPPFLPPYFEETTWGDVREIQGFDVSAQQDVSNQQFQAGRGTFVARSGQDLKLNDTFRSEDGIYIKLIADPIKAPAHSPTQIERWVYEITNRSTAAAENELGGRAMVETTAEELCTKIGCSLDDASYFLADYRLQTGKGFSHEHLNCMKGSI